MSFFASHKVLRARMTIDFVIRIKSRRISPQILRFSRESRNLPQISQKSPHPYRTNLMPMPILCEK
ncbi:hypothetical protein [Helicobacter sp. 23-1045]